MPQRAGLPWALWHWNVMLRGKRLGHLKPTLTYYMHASLSPGYMIMSHRAADTFIRPVVIRNKPHYTQRLWFVINIHKGCGGSSSPSNPLISLNKKNGAGREDGNMCVGGGAAGTFRSWRGEWEIGEGRQKRGVGCNIQGPCIPWWCKLCLELFPSISKCRFNICGSVNKTPIRGELHAVERCGCFIWYLDDKGVQVSVMQCEKWQKRHIVIDHNHWMSSDSTFWVNCS